MPGATVLGDRIKVMVRTFNNHSIQATIAVPTDTNGNAYQLDATINIDDGFGDLGQVAVFSAPVTTAGTPTISAVLTNAEEWTILVDEHSGLRQIGAPVDVFVIGTGTGSTPNSGNTAVTTAANELVWGGAESSVGGQPFAAGGGSTLYVTDTSAGPVASEDKDSGASGGAQSSSGTWSASVLWAMFCIVYNLAGAAVPSPSGNPWLTGQPIIGRQI